MRIIAVESATEACSIALYIDGEIQERFEIAPQQHAKLLLPWLQHMLASADLGLGQLDGLAVSRGPGSFTGVRLGISLIQGIAYATDLPVATVSTLQAMTMDSNQEQPPTQVFAALDARMNEIYCAGYRGDRLLIPERVCHPELATLANGAWLGVGSGFARYPEALTQALAPQLTDTRPQWWPRASRVAQIGATMIANGQGVAAALVQPTYLRDRVAQSSP